jgi:hypothetical protein
MRIFSSAEWCLRVARRMSLIVFSAVDVCGPAFGGKTIHWIVFFSASLSHLRFL